MSYIDKKVALQYLANSEKLFDKLKTSFITKYSDVNIAINDYLKANDFEGLHNYVHQIKGISLNIGSTVLFDDSVMLLQKIEKREVTSLLVNSYIEAVLMAIEELKLL